MVGLPQRPQHRHTVCPREIEVKQDEVIPLDFNQFKRFVSVITKIHAVRQPP